MARINTNIPALVARRHFVHANDQLQVSLERLSSGVRINRGADDPAGLIISQNLRSEINAVKQAITNSQRASNVIATTEGALNEVAALLNDTKQKIVEAANVGAVSDDEIRANQLQIDSAIESITRIANTTTFGGRKLLNGALDYVTSGVNVADVTDLRINGARFGTAAFIPVTVSVTQSAQHAQLRFENSSITADVTLEVAGNNGVTTLPLLSGTTASAIMAAVNLVSDSTGVSASLINAANAASGIVLSTQAFGSDSFVSVAEIGTTSTVFATVNAAAESVRTDTGRDAAATVNGALSLGKGLNISLNTTALSLEFRLQEAFNTVGTTSFAVTGGGALFQLGGDVESNQQVNIGVQSTAASRLGNATVGYLSQVSSGGEFSLVNGEAARADQIIDEAIRQVSVLRGRLGAFEKNTLDTNINQLQITTENLTSAESAIRDIDFAEETSNLTRLQILSQAGITVLAIANQTPQQVLALLQ